ncbi:restriction endonuclease subunit S [Bacillus cereus]|uniref:restriction endonuclease subunit S n=1 Tax=Bacillus cereus TaxID=1396 RepID=UPI0011A4FB3C|nr:restriction endonuclease subunit S [Bacillus cereus]
MKKIYLEYKDSENDLIKDIPIHWKTTKLKHVAKIIMGQSPSSDDYNDKEIGFPFLQGNAEFTEQYPIPKIYCDKPNKLSRKGDILLSVRAPVGALNMSNVSYAIGRGLCAIRAEKITTEFLWFCLLSAKKELNTRLKGSTFEAVTTEDVKNITIVCPVNDEEQNKISSYLTRKVFEINNLITEKEKIITLLEEKRQSMITEAVTKGLNPNMKMKDSGVEWIGKIPEHWELNLLKRYCGRITDGSHFSPEIVDDGFSYVTVKDIQNSEVNVKNALKISEGDYLELCKSGCQPQRGDVLLSKDGTIGKVAVTTNEEYVVLSSIAILTPNQLIGSYYLAYWLRSKINFDQMESYLAGAALRRLTLQTINKFKIIVPPVVEQIKIVEYLDKELRVLENCISEVSNQIQKLKEYRQSLIYEAVTGKIDVRDFEVEA